jgi:tRNA pseudouridine13 synthase
MRLPILTADLPGIGGRLKVKPEDFLVEEIPLYIPSGEGQHIFVEIEKTGLSTYAAARRIARALGVSPGAIGHAGLKDARAITRQTMSIDRAAPEQVEALDLPNIKILNVNRHHNKLRTGHLAGNRFVIRVRDVNREDLPAAEAVLAVLGVRGVPNLFGEQRFGKRGNTGRLGELLIRGDTAEFVAEHLGRPQLNEAPQVQAARQLIDEGQWSEALKRWPRYLAEERRIVVAILKADGRLDVAFKALNKKLKSLFVSAFQSQLFNMLLADRLEHIDQLEDGDVAFIHGNGAAFIVDDALAEQPRVDRFEVSPSGPMFGQKTLMATGRPGEKERAVLSAQNLTLDSFRVDGLKIRGGRRPYRFKLKDAKLWWDDGLMVSFELQPGAYATTVMAEVMKTDRSSP